MPTCCGWTPHTQQTLRIQVLPEALAQLHQVSPPMLSHNKEILMSNSLTSSSARLDLQRTAQDLALHLPQRHHQLHLQAHRTALVAVWMPASICVLLTSLQRA